MKELVTVFPADKLSNLIYRQFVQKFKIPDETFERLSNTQKEMGEYITYGIAGMPDLLLFNKNQNRLLFCEVKSQNDRFSKLQIDFINWNREYDCLPFVLAIILKGNYPQWDITDKF